MQKLLLSFAIGLLPTLLAAQQPCSNPQSSIDLNGNNVRGRILNGGDLFTDLQSGQFIPNPDPLSNSEPSTIYAAGLWIGGVDGGVNLKLAATDYRSNNRYDYAAGPLNPDGITDNTTCSNWDRHFRVTDDEIVAFRAALPMSASALKTQFPGIAGWPGVGNPYFQDINGFTLPFSDQALAPFYDEDNDGLYNPLNGDYPAVLVRGMAPFVPSEIVWNVFNDHKGGGPHSSSGGKPLQMEIRLTSWTFDCPNEPVLNNTIFTAHKFINRATDVCDSTFVGIWADIDLGCYLDDYVGSNPDLNTIFAYNQDAIDGQPGANCQGTPTFGDASPVQTITYLNRPLDKFIVANGNIGGSQPPGTVEPQTPAEYYNYLTGRWRDGTPLTQGGNGYGGTTPVDHHFPDDPADPNGWSMCSTLLPQGDYRLISSSKIGLLQPGQVEELVLAWAFHPDPDLPCGLGTAMADVQTLQNIYNDGFDKVCSALNTSLLSETSISLTPNPASDQVVVSFPNHTPESIRIFDAQGKMVREISAGLGSAQNTVSTAGLPAGLYTLQWNGKAGVASRKLVIMR
ncbi:MAG: T9SS type A sorting domain-containing protein [Chitinophagales bacterium]|nr:T9SS type A sorting domain-containing protein [Chitinophagales bacterium]